MTTFALVHGAFHGGWCWELLESELSQRGHTCVAPTLPIDDPSAGNAAYAATVVDALSGHDEDVVVVGHSQGGLTIPYVAAARPVQRLIYLAAAIPVPGESWADFMAAHPDFLKMKMEMDVAFDEQGRMAINGSRASTTFFHDCPDDLRTWAISQLRPQSTTPILEICTATVPPEVLTDYIVCLGDQALEAAQCRTLAHERLGVVAHELPGSHSPFLARPEELADLLVGLVQKSEG